MTDGNVLLWRYLFVLVLSMVIGGGGLLWAISGKTWAWRVVGASVAVHFLNCAILLIYCLH
jgi:hypothetical protein